MKTAHNRLDHSETSLPLSWYAHALSDNDKKAADLVGNLFASQPLEPRNTEVKTAYVLPVVS